MRSSPFPRRLLALLCLPLLSTACATTSTPSAIARSERPKLPTLSPELVRSEHITALKAKPSGQMLTIDKAVLDELIAQHGALLAAVERGNNRAAGVKRWRACVAAVFATGVAPAPCANP